MKRIFLRKLLIAFSAFAALVYGVVWACGWSDWDEYGVSVFTPEPFVDSAFRPFFYSDLFYYEISYDNSHIYRFNERIVEEWQEYLGRSKQDTELRYFLLKMSLAAVDSVLQFDHGSLPAPLASLKLVREKSNPKISAFLKLLHYAKSNESYAAVSRDYWSYSEKQELVPLSPQQLEDRESMIREMKGRADLFVRQRYFFQVVRSYFFSSEYKECISFYEQYKHLFPFNTLGARCMSYVAGAYYKQGDYAKANYLYAQVYDAGAEFKTVAHYSFHPQEESDWKQTLALCQNKQQQATLWHLLGIYFDEERAIEEIYRLDPGSNKLDLLLVRLINKQEIRSNTERVEYGGAAYRPGRDSLSQSVLKLVSAIADGQKTSKPYLWCLSAGYLHFINRDYAKAEQYYRQSMKTIPADTLALAQLRLLSLMNKVAATKTMDNQSKSELLPDLLWLQYVHKNSLPHFRYVHAEEWIRQVIAGKYSRQKNELYAELFVHTDTFFTDTERVEQLKIFLLSEQSDAFDQYCKSIYDITASQVAEFQYVSLAYDDKIDEALLLIDQSVAVEDIELLGNPFNGTIKDCHDCDHAAPQKTKYSKVSMLRKMKEMKDLMDAGTDVFNNSLLLGNAFYNMSHYGNARYFYEGAVMGSAHSSPVDLPYPFQKMLTSQAKAKEYYRKSLAAATTDEQKAKLNYLLLKCERNELYNRLYQNPDYRSWEYGGMPANDFAPLLPYKHTRYYNEVLAECGYFRAYLKHRR